MKTLTYQGRTIEARLLGEIGGYCGTLLGQERGGLDQLWRDKQGRLYMYRQRFATGEGLPEYNHEAVAAGTLWKTTHAVNINAAILWAIDCLGDSAWDLRRAAADLLMEGRGYRDPHPSHLSVEQRALMDGVHGSQPHGDGQYSVQLDELASAMLSRTVQEGCATQPAGEDPRDLVNAAVTYYLCDDTNHRHGELDLDDSADALERAKRDRLASEQAAPKLLPDPQLQVTADEDGLTHLVFEYAATKDCGAVACRSL